MYILEKRAPRKTSAYALLNSKSSLLKSTAYIPSEFKTLLSTSSSKTRVRCTFVTRLPRSTCLMYRFQACTMSRRARVDRTSMRSDGSYGTGGGLERGLFVDVLALCFNLLGGGWRAGGGGTNWVWGAWVVWSGAPGSWS